MRPSNGDFTQLDGSVNLKCRREVRARELRVGVLSMYMLFKCMELYEVTRKEL